MDRIKNECETEKIREAGLRWFAHVQKMEREYTGQSMLKMELPGKE